MVGNVDARIDGINEGVNRVLCTAKVIWERDVEQVISVFAMSHFQLPPGKVGLFFNLDIKTHVLVKLKDRDVWPKDRFDHTGPYNLSSGTLENDWQDLLKVSTKDNSKTTKGLVRVAQIPKGAIHCLHNMTVLHGCLIPYDQVSVKDQGSKWGVFGDGAYGRLMTGNRDLET